MYSAVRTLSPSANFKLTEHGLYGTPPSRDDNQLVLLSVQHDAANNLDGEAAQLLRRTKLEASS